MPFVANMNAEDEDKKNQPQGGGAVHLAPSAGVQSGSGNTAGAAPTKAGGQFASLNQYLTANQGKAEPLAQKLTTDINKQYQGLEGQNQQALSAIGNQVSATPSYSNANSIIAEEAANPVSFTSDPSKVSSFQSLLGASYAGPKSAESTNEYANQQASINKAIAEGQKNVQSEAGRQSLIAKNVAKPTTGVTALNSAILSKSPEALASVEGAYKPFANLLTGLQSGAAEQNKAIAERTSQAEAAKNAANEAIKSQITGLNTDVTNKLTSAQKNLASQNEKIKAELAAGTPSDPTLKALDMTRDQWNSLSAAKNAAATSRDVLSNQGQFGAKTGTTNIDFNSFLNQTDPNSVVNIGNVATPEDYAKAKAFQSLVGNLGLQTPELAINPNAAAQAGTAPSEVSNFDYQNALNTAQQTTADQLASAQAYVDALQSGADEQHAQLAAQNAAKNKGKAVLAGLAQTPLAATAAAVKGVTQAVKTITNIFCFHPDTLVTMDNGSQLPICRIGVGDITKGGKVLATTRAVAQDFYWYNGVIVTGKHAVKEDGKWVRVENSRLGHRFKYLTEIVCNLVTEKHRIYANGIEFADQYETDRYEELNMDESLKELNKDA